MAETLDAIPAGAHVLVDASVLVYHLTGTSERCRRLLERCERREVTGVTTAAVLAELTHRLMALEAVARGLVHPGRVVRKLAERPDVVKQLRRYQQAVESVPLMGLRVESLELSDLLAAHGLRERHGLLTNDSLVAAAALEHAEGRIASGDAAFARVDGLTLHVPGDLAGGTVRRR